MKLSRIGSVDLSDCQNHIEINNVVQLKKYYNFVLW